ncbi:hypothetical protein MO767_16940 [Pseudomonas sp. UYIF39]|uniref:hypothetical protein n=1 Tax=Pseudomonas sp. UYIF39 TaxID=1630747 RepID=UPI00249DDB4F|nr:hypothetical protein [Pseudomonas sp. UYIF39]MDI3356023.1 hypothetical protein [Pseudomonas sp. UYIF39]
MGLSLLGIGWFAWPFCGAVVRLSAKIGVGDKGQTILAANAVDNVRVQKKDAFIDEHVFH